MKVKSKVTIHHKQCGHTAERVIMHKYEDYQDKQSKIKFYKNRIKCPECENKEMYGKNEWFETMQASWVPF